MNIKLKPNEWVTKTIPLTLIKHRLVVTDPTYKFTINALLHGRSNIAVRRDSNNNDYYDIMNMSVLQDTVTSPIHWVNYINKNFNLNLNLGGTEFQSVRLPELFFTLEDSRNIFDAIYGIIQDNQGVNSEGVNIIVDFNIKLSGGFIRNKLGIDTKDIKNWILDSLNFSILKLIMTKDSLTENFKVADNYKTVYGLNKSDVELLESVFTKNSDLYPKFNDNNIFWYYLNQYVTLDSLASKETLFGFRFRGAIVTEVHTKDVSFALNDYNRPMYIQTQSKFDYNDQKVYVTLSGPSVPISIVGGSILKRDEPVEPSKNIQTKINNHIYMVNKK